ncbi:hypothetical protein [Pseudomonas cichorii]|nr:hypothetical protein [Pseudomonas cichorii]
MLGLKGFDLLMSLVLITGFCQSVSADLQVPVEQKMLEPKLTVLTDKLHALKDSLAHAEDTHIYSFTAVRGQGVIARWSLAPSVKLEINDGAAWRSPENAQEEVLFSLKPGQEVRVRLSQRRDFPYVANESYRLIFGSFPRLARVRLKDQPYGMARIPAGVSSLGQFSSQGISSLVLEVDMTDSTGKPLEGAAASLGIDLPQSTLPEIDDWVVSDASGKATKTIDIGRCVGGRDAGNFIDKHQAQSAWRSQYHEGSWIVINSFAPFDGPHAPVPDRGQIGHICHQHLIRQTP